MSTSNVVMAKGSKPAAFNSLSLSWRLRICSLSSACVMAVSFSGAVFYGGGYGHGVGMSQNGVKGMIDAGYGYEDILKHYYKGISITKKY